MLLKMLGILENTKSRSIPGDPEMVKSVNNSRKINNFFLKVSFTTFFLMLNLNISKKVDPWGPQSPFFQKCLEFPKIPIF